jgi:hypothetical protein
VVPETLRVAVDDVDKGVDKGVDRSVDEKHQNSDSSALLSMPLSTKSTLPPTRPDSSLRFGMTNLPQVSFPLQRCAAAPFSGYSDDGLGR